MAAIGRARLLETRPADKSDKHASDAKQGAALSKTTSKMPSPAVAAAILDGAERTPRRPLTPAPTRPKTAPPPLSSEKSPARPEIAPPVAAPAAVVVQKPLPAIAQSPASTDVRAGATARTAPVLKVVPKPAPAETPAAGGGDAAKEEPPAGKEPKQAEKEQGKD